MEGCKYLKVVLGLEDQPARQHTHRFLGGASAPHHMDLSSGCLSVLPARQLASPRAGSPRVSEEESEMPLMAHFSVVTCCHFCLILFIRSESLSSVTHLPTVVVVVLLLSCSYSLQPHELQHPRLPCSSLSPRV